MITQPPAMNDATVLHMINATLDGLSLNPKQEREDHKAQFDAATAALDDLHPRDAVEAMLAARAVTAHHAALECFRRAALPEVSDAMMVRLFASAAAMSRLSAQAIQALERRQALGTRGPRPVAPASYPATAEARPGPAANSRRQDPLPSERPPASPAPQAAAPTTGGQASPLRQPAPASRPLHPTHQSAAGTTSAAGLPAKPETTWVSRPVMTREEVAALSGLPVSMIPPA